MSQPWSPDFSRAPRSARQAWDAITSSRSVAAIIAADLTPEDDQILAALITPLVTAITNVRTSRT